MHEGGELAQLVPSPDSELYAGEDNDPEDEDDELPVDDCCCEPEVENLAEPLTMMVEIHFHLNHAGGLMIYQTGVFPREAVLDVQLLAGRMGDSKESRAAIRLIMLVFPQVMFQSVGTVVDIMFLLSDLDIHIGDWGGS